MNNVFKLIKTLTGSLSTRICIDPNCSIVALAVWFGPLAYWKTGQSFAVS